MRDFSFAPIDDSRVQKHMAVFVFLFDVINMFFICIKEVNMVKSLVVCEKMGENRRIGADMALLLWLLMALVPFALGKGALRILYGNQPTQDMGPADCMLTGGMIVIGLAEAAHLGACLLGRSFSDCVILFVMALGVCLVVSTIICFVSRKTRKDNRLQQRKAERERVKRILLAGNTEKQQLVYVVFVVIVAIQLVLVAAVQNVYFDGDMTLETVNSFLATDAVYQVNPMTGELYTLGIPFRLKILCLPTFYGILCRSFGLSAEAVVLGIVPPFVLLGSYLAYGIVAKRLFPKDKVKRGVFLVLIAILLGVGNYMPGMDGFGVMHSGFRGVTIRAAILLPYTFGLMLRKKYKLVVLCVLAEACIVWTFYGMGACVAVAVGMLCVEFAMKWLAKRNGRKGDDLCKNS